VLPGDAAAQVTSWRWVAFGVIIIGSSLNYLDRQLLAAVAPSLKAEYGLSNANYGLLLSAFSFAYMLVTPLAGLFIDRVGVSAGLMIATAAWSVAGAATGLASTLRGLIGCRVALGLSEASVIPAAAKATATYLHPREMGVGTAVQMVGIFGGSVSAPLIVAAVAPIYGWRGAFVICGLLGFAWIPLWALVNRRASSAAPAGDSLSFSIRDVLRDSRLWGIVATSALTMTLYSVWMNWTTVYFVQQLGLSQTDANRYFAWIPPLFATLGGLFGGWLAMRQIDRGSKPVDARLRICLVTAPALLITAAVPHLRTPGLAAAAISLSFFGCMTILTNLHVIPIDLFGAKRAALTSAALTCMFALTSTITSPLIGVVVDRFGFGVLCAGVSVLPGLGALILRATVK
jgi:ACS family hexuronate transporter-like MFS transporter